MTTADERTRALLHAGDLLEHIRRDKTVSDALRDQAETILRHYPSAMEIGWIADAEQQCDTIIPLLDPDAVPAEIRKGYRR